MGEEMAKLPGTEIYIRCFKCDHKLTATRLDVNPFPPDKDYHEWWAATYTCPNCGDTGTFQYRVTGTT
jgi:DNA-directed RNA polymerase subunit RPC12/RpoP